MKRKRVIYELTPLGKAVLAAEVKRIDQVAAAIQRVGSVSV